MVHISLYWDCGGIAKDVDELNLIKVNHLGGFLWVINTLKFSCIVKLQLRKSRYILGKYVLIHGVVEVVLKSKIISLYVWILLLFQYN